MSGKELEFVVFIIHKLAQSWQKKPSEVYKILNDTKILNEYILTNYEVLHSLGEEYLIADISELVEDRSRIYANEVVSRF